MVIRSSSSLRPSKKNIKTRVNKSYVNSSPLFLAFLCQPFRILFVAVLLFLLRGSFVSSVATTLSTHLLQQASQIDPLSRLLRNFSLGVHRCLLSGSPAFAPSCRAVTVFEQFFSVCSLFHTSSSSNIQIYFLILFFVASRVLSRSSFVQQSSLQLLYRDSHTCLKIFPSIFKKCASPLCFQHRSFPSR